MSCQCSMIPIADAAAQMHTTELNVLMHVKRGLIAGEETDGEWFIHVDSLVDFQNSTGEKQTVVVTKAHCCSSGCGSGCGS